jgi:drug/metabolite transporter (DMT)-like permease
MNSKIYGSFLVLVSASCFGLMGILARYAYAADISIGNLLFFRFFFAAVLFWSWIFYKKIQWRLPVKRILTLLMMGIGGYAMMAILLFTSFSLLPVSLAETVYYLYPVFVVILTSLLSKHSLELSKLMAILFSLIGLYFMLGADFSQLNIIGFICALSCGILYAFYIVQTEKIQNYMSPFVSSAFVTSFAAIALFIFTVFNHGFTLEIRPMGWLSIFGVSIFSTFLAILTFAMGIERIGSSKAALLSVFEPIVTVSLSSFIFHDILGQTQKLGIFLILISALLTQFSWKKSTSTIKDEKSIYNNVSIRRDAR